MLMGWRELLLVGSGGFLGAVLRFALGGVAQRFAAESGFPLGTLVVNVLGCLAIGFLGGLVEFRQALDAGARLFVLVGVLGGFTTFSSFAFETLALAADGAFGRAALNVVAQFLLGLGAAVAGYIGARAL